MSIIYPAGVPEVPVSSQESAALLAQPFNPEKVGELSVAALTGVGLTDAWIFEITAANSLITFAVPQDTAQNVIDNAIAALNAVCIDPTRNQLTEDQKDDASVAAKIVSAKANKALIKGPEDANGQQTGPGLKDKINGNTTLGVTGLKDRLLTNAAWNALTTAQKLDVLRDNQRGVGGATPFDGHLDITFAILNIILDGTQADLTELRLLRDRLLSGQDS